MEKVNEKDKKASRDYYHVKLRGTTKLWKNISRKPQIKIQFALEHHSKLSDGLEDEMFVL